MRVSCFAILILCIAATPRLDAAHAREVLQALLDQPNDQLLPDGQQTIMAIEPSRLSADEVKEALPLALRCLQSSRPSLKPYGVDFMFLVALRPDGSQMLEPYLDGLALFLSDTDHAVRRAALVAMSGANPKPSAKAVAHLWAHFGDSSNTSDEVVMIATGLLGAVQDPASVRRVLDVVRNRKEPGLTSSVLDVLGLIHIQSDDALTFIRQGFSAQSPHVRAAAVDAVSRMPEGLKSTFEAELRHVLSNPDELDQTRARAQAVLTGH